MTRQEKISVALPEKKRGFIKDTAPRWLFDKPPGFKPGKQELRADHIARACAWINENTTSCERFGFRQPSAETINQGAKKFKVKRSLLYTIFKIGL